MMAATRKRMAERISSACSTKLFLEGLLVWRLKLSCLCSLACIGSVFSHTMTLSTRALAIFAAISVVAATTIHNNHSWTTTNGDILPLQDGNVVQGPDGTWYFAGMSYGLCKEQVTGCHNVSAGNCGFFLNHTVVVYSNTAFQQHGWSFVADILPTSDGSRPLGVYFRPKLAFHPVDKRWVLWVRWLSPQGLQGNDHFLVATSPSIDGAFTVRNANASLLHFNGADFGLFTEGADAFIAYTARTTDTTVSVEQLTPDWLGSAALTNSSATSGLIGPNHVESPVMFKRGEWYYVLDGHLCCFCASGSGTNVMVAPHPLGPYSFLGNSGLSPQGHSVSGGQMDFALVLSAFSNGTARAEPLVLLQSNQWQSAPDRLKDHDLQYWTPLTFTATAQPGIEQLQYVDEFDTDHV